ncbi:MAG: Lon protease-like protein [Burkholderiaceae bacterium]|jgi:Lon protease-like protein
MTTTTKNITTDGADWLPLFPLQTVLFPDGILPLRIFETRYIDMVRECMRLEKPFGVVAIREGTETGQPAQPEAVGCSAAIVHWDMEAGGLLMIGTRGGLRFRIRETRLLADQRLEARVDYLDADPAMAPLPGQADCVEALKAITDDFDQRIGKNNVQDYPFALPLRLDDAGWIANRWSEILPLTLKTKQELLELNDPAMRLTLIHACLEQQQLLQG